MEREPPYVVCRASVEALVRTWVSSLEERDALYRRLNKLPCLCRACLEEPGEVKEDELPF